MQFRHLNRVLALVVLAASCSLGNSGDAGSMNLYLEVDKGTLPVDESMTITVTARNVGYDPVSLTGPSDCLLNVEVLDTTGNIVWHSYQQCMGGIVTEELLAAQDKVQVFTWNGTNLAGARLSSGFYHVRGVARVTGAAYLGPPLSVSIE